MLAWDKDGLDIFGARISRWRVTKLIVLMPRLDFQVEGGTLFAEAINFDDALGKLLLQVLTISSQNKRAHQRFRMQFLQFIPNRLVDDRMLDEGVGCSTLAQMILMLRAETLDKMAE